MQVFRDIFNGNASVDKEVLKREEPLNIYRDKDRLCTESSRTNHSPETPETPKHSGEFLSSMEDQLHSVNASCERKKLSCHKDVQENKLRTELKKFAQSLNGPHLKGIRTEQSQYLLKKQPENVSDIRLKISNEAFAPCSKSSPKNQENCESKSFQSEIIDSVNRTYRNNGVNSYLERNPRFNQCRRKNIAVENDDLNNDLRKFIREICPNEAESTGHVQNRRQKNATDNSSTNGVVKYSGKINSPRVLRKSKDNFENFMFDDENPEVPKRSDFKHPPKYAYNERQFGCQHDKEEVSSLTDDGTGEYLIPAGDVPSNSKLNKRESTRDSDRLHRQSKSNVQDARMDNILEECENKITQTIKTKKQALPNSKLNQFCKGSGKGIKNHTKIPRERGDVSLVKQPMKEMKTPRRNGGASGSPGPALNKDNCSKKSNVEDGQISLKERQFEERCRITEESSREQSTADSDIQSIRSIPNCTINNISSDMRSIGETSVKSESEQNHPVRTSCMKSDSLANKRGTSKKVQENSNASLYPKSSPERRGASADFECGSTSRTSKTNFKPCFESSSENTGKDKVTGSQNTIASKEKFETGHEELFQEKTAIEVNQLPADQSMSTITSFLERSSDSESRTFNTDAQETVSDKVRRWGKDCHTHERANSISSSASSKELLKKFNSGTTMASMLYGSPSEEAFIPEQQSYKSIPVTTRTSNESYRGKQLTEHYETGVEGGCILGRGDCRWSKSSPFHSKMNSPKFPVQQYKYSNASKTPVMNYESGNSMTSELSPKMNAQNIYKEPQTSDSLTNTSVYYSTFDTARTYPVASNFPVFFVNPVGLLHPNVFVPHVSCGVMGNNFATEVPFQRFCTDNVQMSGSFQNSDRSDYEPDTTNVGSSEQQNAHGAFGVEVVASQAFQNAAKFNPLAGKISNNPNSKLNNSKNTIKGQHVLEKPTCNQSTNRKYLEALRTATEIESPQKRSNFGVGNSAICNAAGFDSPSNQVRDASKAIRDRLTSGRDMASVMYGANWIGSSGGQIQVTSRQDKSLRQEHSDKGVEVIANACQLSSNGCANSSGLSFPTFGSSAETNHREFPRRPRGIVPGLEDYAADFAKRN